jgi:hypothetical protein
MKKLVSALLVTSLLLGWSYNPINTQADDSIALHTEVEDFQLESFKLYEAQHEANVFSLEGSSLSPIDGSVLVPIDMDTNFSRNVVSNDTMAEVLEPIDSTITMENNEVGSISVADESIQLSEIVILEPIDGSVLVPFYEPELSEIGSFDNSASYNYNFVGEQNFDFEAASLLDDIIFTENEAPALEETDSKYDLNSIHESSEFSFEGSRLDEFIIGDNHGLNELTSSSEVDSFNTMNASTRGSVTVQYRSNLHTNGTVPASQIITTPGSIALRMQGTLARTNYIFGGWRDSVGNIFAAGQTVTM